MPTVGLSTALRAWQVIDAKELVGFIPNKMSHYY